MRDCGVRFLHTRWQKPRLHIRQSRDDCSRNSSLSSHLRHSIVNRIQSGSSFAVELAMFTRPRSVLNAVLCALAVAVILVMTSLPAFAQGSGDQKLDAVLQTRLSQLRGRSRVIVQYTSLEDVRAITSQNGRVRRRLARAHAHVAEVDNIALQGLAADPRVARVMVDRPAFATMFRTGTATGAALVRQDFGVTGRGVGIAFIDSGITPSHEDIAADRIVYFKDFTREAGDPLASEPTDEYGHGTHVAAIAAGRGADGRHIGMAPAA